MLEEAGLVRVIEAVNCNKHILKLNVGVVTDNGLEMLSELLKENSSLEEIFIEETSDHQKYWTERGRQSFCRMLKNFTQLKRVKLATNRDTTMDSVEKEEHELFLQEIAFYTSIKSKEQIKLKEYTMILDGCGSDALFANVVSCFEDRLNNNKMPVRKFFNNTFGILINNALFKLQKEQ
jgi:hypothetical protein